VIQKHAARRLHYDLRLELDGVMKSWAITRGPSLVPGEKRLAVHVEDHPIEYNRFEGNIPAGQYGAGTVMVWDRGRWIPEGDPHEGYAKGHLRFRLEGERLRGGWHLVRMRQRKGERNELWLLIKAHDEAARSPDARDILEEETRSVVTGRTMEEIAANRPARTRTRKAGNSASRARKPRRMPARKSKAHGAKRSAKHAARQRKSTAHSKSEAEGVSEAHRIPGARPAPLPDFVEPCLASLQHHPPAGSAWVHEIKFDGYRLLAWLKRGTVKLFTRRGLDWTAKFEPIAAAIAAAPATQAFIDGEVVVEGDNGVSSFSALQEALSAGRTERLVYYAFDLLHLDGYDLTASPLLARKGALQHLVARLHRPFIRLSEHFEEDGAVLLEHVCRLKLEGIVSKRRDAPYRSGRCNDWIKTKCSDSQEFVIAGYGPSTALDRSVGSLVLGYYSDGVLRYAGRAGTGFTRRAAQDLWRRLEPLRRERTPFATLPPQEKGRPVRWVRPALVAEINFRGWTADGIVRHAVFKGLREDKPAVEVEREVPSPLPAASAGRSRASRQGRAAARAPRTAASARSPAPRSSSGQKSKRSVPAARLTHPDRVYWPDIGLTKQALAEYYAEIWDWIAPHLVGRPLTLVRCPDGITGPCFYQKHVWAGLELVRIHRVVDATQGEVFAIEDLEGLLALVQVGVLEIHVWGSRITDLEHCDRLVFDLDPAPQVAWTAVVEAAREVRARLEAIGVASFVKTSGGKGLHVVVPIRGVPWEEAKRFTQAIAHSMASDSPGRYVATMAKSKRTGRIFVDYLRNGRGATSVVAYSTRARAGAPVSAPVRWDELKPELTADHFNVANMLQRLARLRRDPWADFTRLKQTLPRQAARAV
jgi:bifunctional non-homologous end joining protein LigD